MDESLSDWLRLREPADVSARSEALTSAITAAMPSGEPVYALDLATGTGSNIRYLAERLPGRQRWLAVDRSADLLADLLDRMSAWGASKGYDVRIDANAIAIRGPRLDCHIETLQMDLGTLSDRVLFAGRHLVTAAALLDLVSESWLRALATHCRAEGATVLCAITYTGRSWCDPAEPEDDLVRELFNRHQKTDKRLGGPAAGPDAAELAERCLADGGFLVRREPSDWTLDPADRDVQRLLIDGWAHAATEVEPLQAPTIAAWHARRLAHVDAGRSRIGVGHDDIAAWPPRHA